MKIRPNTWDAKIITAVLLNNEYALPNDMSGMSVLDIGAHVGSFAVACLRRGATKVVCYEPDKDWVDGVLSNFGMLKANIIEETKVGDGKIVMLEDKAVSHKVGRFKVRHLTEHDAHYGRNTGHVDIFGELDKNDIDPEDTVHIDSILNETTKYDWVKLDCEGSEWGILLNGHFANVRNIVAELHAIPDNTDSELISEFRGQTLDDMCQRVNEKLRADGFDVKIMLSSPVTAQMTANRREIVQVIDRKPKVMWIGDAVVPTGYGRVTKEICTGLLSKDWDVVVLGIGYNGDPHDLPFRVYPAVDANTPGSRNGIERLKPIIEKEKPDVICIHDDHWNVGAMIDVMAMQNIWVPTVGYIAVDSGNVRADVAIQLKNLKHAICHTQFGVDQLEGAGYRGKSSVAGHGVDSDLYTLYDKKQARAGIPSEKNLDDAFLWGVVGVNQPRKRLDLSIAYFAAWWRAAGKPDNVYLYVHTNSDGTTDLRQLVDYCEVRGRTLATQGGIGLPEESLPTLYNALDCMISTSEGESWGLTHLEGMACGVPQIAVDCGGMPSWAGNSIYWVNPTVYQFTQNRTNTKRWIATEEHFVAAMNDMYNSPELRQSFSLKGRLLAEKLKWSDTVTHFDKTLREVLAVQKAVTEVDCLAEF